MEGVKMAVVIRSSMLEYLATAHAMSAIFGCNGRSASKIKYAENLMM
jgi:hypothetical protein